MPLTAHERRILMHAAQDHDKPILSVDKFLLVYKLLYEDGKSEEETWDLAKVSARFRKVYLTRAEKCHTVINTLRQSK